MLNRDNVTFQLTRLGILFRRKIDSRVVELYSNQLERHLDDEKFMASVNAIAEEDDRFPTVKRLLEAGRAHRRREKGRPVIVNRRRQELAGLEETLAAVEQGMPVPLSDQFHGRKHIPADIERLIYESAAVEVPLVLGQPFDERAAAIAAFAEAEIAKVQAHAERTAPPAAT